MAQLTACLTFELELLHDECLKLGNGRSIMTPPPSGLALIARARRLGL